jgi:hypothetical protein
MTLDKRDFPGPDDVNDQRLRHQRFDEPASLKKPGRGRIPAVKDVKHHKEGGVIKIELYGANKQNKPRYGPDLPGPWFRGLVRRNVIGRDRDLRKVIQEIVREHLQRSHRHKGQEGRSPPAH